MVWVFVASTAALVLVVALNVALTVLLMDRLERKDREHAEDRRAWALERRELNQRIQAPEIATVQAIDVTRDGPAYVSPENDEEFWQAANG